MDQLVCACCNSNEFKSKKLGLKCSFCGTIYRDEHEKTVEPGMDGLSWGYSSSCIMTYPIVMGASMMARNI